MSHDRMHRAREGLAFFLERKVWNRLIEIFGDDGIALKRWSPPFGVGSRHADREIPGDRLVITAIDSVVRGLHPVESLFLTYTT